MLMKALTKRGKHVGRDFVQWGRIKIQPYPAMLYLGTVSGVIGGTCWAAFQGLAAAKVYAAILLLFLPTLVGARLLFVFFHWKIYRRQPGRIWRRTEGGAALYGGLIVSLLVSMPLLRALDIHFWAFWDAAAVAMLIGIVFTRIGCLLHGCCAGRPCESFLALYLPNAHGVWRYRFPTQLFEAGLAALLLLCSFLVSGRLPFEGSLFLGSLASYGIGRWTLETTRESIDRIGQWSLQRMISVGFVVLAATVLLLKCFLWNPAATMGF